MRRRNGNRAREVPFELLSDRHHSVPGEFAALTARFAGRSPGADLLADVAEAGGVEADDLARFAARGHSSPTAPEAASASRLVGALPRARQRGAQTRWLDRHLPPEQHQQARATMLHEEMCHHYG